MAAITNMEMSIKGLYKLQDQIETWFQCCNIYIRGFSKGVKLLKC